MMHVVFLQNEPMNGFLDGSKRVEFRIAHRRQPWVRASVGDVALLKRCAGEVELAGDIIAIDLVDVRAGGDMAAFIARWRHLTLDGGQYLGSKPGARYGAAVTLGNIQRATFPAEHTPRGARNGWVTLNPALSSQTATAGGPSVADP
jgi:hypothetical protein